jgi:serpin B
MRPRHPCTLPPCVALALAVGCPPASALEKESDGTSAYVEASNAFAFDLYSKLASGKGNLFFSPFSIHMALTMTHAGARGNTAQAMARTLRFGAKTEALGPAAMRLLAALRPPARQGDQPPFQLEVANALWSDAGYPLLAPFTAALRQDYRAEYRELDFATARAQACETINAWVKETTRDRIQGIVDPAALPALTRLVLTNAIYFKSAWAEQFATSRTVDAPFHLSAARQVPVPLMNQEEDYSYWETPKLRGVEVPYLNHELSMILLVPKEIDGLAAVEKELSLRSFDAWKREARHRSVRLGMPRFRTEATLALRDVLSALGMAVAFTEAADFSGMSSQGDLFIDSVIHKSFIAVDEEGTEAAAVTAVPAAKAAEGEPEEPVVVIADRPFLHAIRHARTGAILFLGRLVEPAGR